MKNSTLAATPKCVVPTIMVILLAMYISPTWATRSEYDITIGSAKTLTSGSGDGYGGGAWYYYPDTGTYIQWFYNDPFSTQRQGYIDAFFYIEPADLAGGTVSGDISYCWTSNQWKNDSQPPLEPENLHYIKKFNVFSQRGLIPNFQSIEPHNISTIADYNPNWVGVMVAGKNIHVYRWLNHSCIGPGEDGGENQTPAPIGACCNYQTGLCSLSAQVYCQAPSVWLGAGTTCDACPSSTTTWDFGDAPVSYPVLNSNNGAKHQIVPGMFLGQNVSPENDGQPGTSANLDSYDDGIQFLNTLEPGQTTTVIITASNHGIINAWIDFNRDGDWADTGEQIFLDEPVSSGNTLLAFTVPSNAQPGPSYARFRFSTQTGLTVSGSAPNGEVEDYMVQISGTTTPGPGPGLSQYPPQSPTYKYVPKWSQASVPAENNTQTLVGWGEPSLFVQRPLVMDDFNLNDGSPITSIRWWGTFSGWNFSYPPSNAPTIFHIGIWSDPLNAGVPNTLVWQTEVTNWSWTFSGYQQDPQSTNQTVFEFGTLLSQDAWFTPTNNQGTQFWISISAVYQQTPPAELWNWMSRAFHSGVGAKKIYTVSTPGQAGQWPPALGDIALNPLPVQSPSGIPQDMSFELITTAEITGSGNGDSFLTADVDGDGYITLQDLSYLVNMWLAENQ